MASRRRVTSRYYEVQSPSSLL